MSTERRDFLKLFGVTSAAFASTVASDRPGGETVFTSETDASIPPLTGPTTFAQLPTRDVVRMQLYSSLELEGDGLRDHHQFFRSDPFRDQLTLGETNLNNCGRLDAPELFLVKRVGLTFAPGCDPDDRNDFLSRYAATVWLAHKYYFRAPAAHLFSTGEVGNGRFQESAMKGFCDLTPLPLLIENQLHFWADVTGKPFRLKGKLKMWMVLDGLHARGIQ